MIPFAVFPVLLLLGAAALALWTDARFRRPRLRAAVVNLLASLLLGELSPFLLGLARGPVPVVLLGLLLIGYPLLAALWLLRALAEKLPRGGGGLGEEA